MVSTKARAKVIHTCCASSIPLYSTKQSMCAYALFGTNIGETLTTQRALSDDITFYFIVVNTVRVIKEFKHE